MFRPKLLGLITLGKAHPSEENMAMVLIAPGKHTSGNEVGSQYLLYRNVPMAECSSAKLTS